MQHGGVDAPGDSGRHTLAEQGLGEEDERPLAGGSSLSSLDSLVRVSKELLRRESDLSVARQSDVGACPTSHVNCFVCCLRPRCVAVTF